MPAIRLARRLAVGPRGLAARAGLVLLATLAGVLVAGRLQVPPAVRTSGVGRVPTALVVDTRTRRVFDDVTPDDAGWPTPITTASVSLP